MSMEATDRRNPGGACVTWRGKFVAGAIDAVNMPVLNASTASLLKVGWQRNGSWRRKMTCETTAPKRRDYAWFVPQGK
jgi:hypothetical protein